MSEREAADRGPVVDIGLVEDVRVTVSPYDDAEELQPSTSDRIVMAMAAAVLVYFAVKDSPHRIAACALAGLAGWLLLPRLVRPFRLVEGRVAWAFSSPFAKRGAPPLAWIT